MNARLQTLAYETGVSEELLIELERIARSELTAANIAHARGLSGSVQESLLAGARLCADKPSLAAYFFNLPETLGASYSGE